MPRSFTVSIREFADLAHANACELVADAAVDMHAAVVRRTPVDTGRARGNWQIGTGSCPDGVIARIDKRPLGEDPGYDEKGNARAFDGKQSVVYIANNLPYIEALEDGHSQAQAPAGMVSVTVGEFEAVVRRNAERLRK